MDPCPFVWLMIESLALKLPSATKPTPESETPAKAPRRLNPSDAMLKHLGKDIVKKSQRRKKYLFSFPGHIAPIGHGDRIGDLKN
ncbi:hypothetical protein K1719_026900 [Acacia pycnantha]|nr:hypothetical protein K1719_026900 [Acacia pycnantha]